MGAGKFENECDVGGRPESKLARGSCRGVLSPGVFAPVPNGNLFSLNLLGHPLFLDDIDAASSSGRLTPESFQKFLYPLSRLSIDMSDALLALDEACLKKVPGWLLVFFRLMKDEKDPILPGFLSLSKREDRSDTGVASPSRKSDRVGESLRCNDGAFWRILDSKNGSESSKESDLGRGIAPLTVDASKPCGTSWEIKKSIASFKPPALFRV